MSSDKNTKITSWAEDKLKSWIDSISNPFKTIQNKEYRRFFDSYDKKCICLFVYQDSQLRKIYSISGYDYDLRKDEPYLATLFPPEEFSRARHELGDCLSYCGLHRKKYVSPRPLNVYKRYCVKRGLTNKEISNRLGLLYSCCERKIIAELKNEGITYDPAKATFYCRYPPCVRCLPAIGKPKYYYLQKKRTRNLYVSLKEHQF
jgi:hypothetical protein